MAVSISLYVYYIFFINSSIDGHLGCFYVMALVYSAATNTGVHVSSQIIILSGYIPGVGLLDHMAALVLGFFFF